MTDVVCTPDGRFVPPADAKVSIFDRSFLFGDSVYETLRTYDGTPFAVTRHLDRLWASMDRLRIRLPLARVELERRLRESHAKSGNAESYLRIVVSRGTGAFGLAQGLDNPAEAWIIARAFVPVPEEAYARGISIVIAKTERNPRAGLDPAIKSGNYLNSIQAMIEAREQGADDAVMLNGAGNVTEATTSSLFAVIDGTVVTPPLSSGILEGVTRHYAMDAGERVVERDFTADDLRHAAEIFVTSTLKEVLPVSRVDGIAKPVGPVTIRMRDLVSRRIRRALSEEP